MCIGCETSVACDAQELCRCCYRQIAAHRSIHGSKVRPDVLRTTGQQLTFAIAKTSKGPSAPAISERTLAWPDRPVPYRQLVLFDHVPDLSGGRLVVGEQRDELLAAALDEHVTDVAGRRRWTLGHTSNVRNGVRIVLALQATPGAAITATEIAVLHQLRLPARNVRELLDEVGMLDDDRTPAVVTWFTTRTDHLPDQMRNEVTEWFNIMHAGSALTPRRRPRSDTTIRLYARWFLPTLQRWADAGTTSLRTITRSDVVDALAVDSVNRSETGRALRSLFQILKSRRLVFLNPTARLRTWTSNDKPAMPVDLTQIDAALNDANRARAAVVALAIYHGLNAGQLRNIELVHIHDRRLHIGTRVVPLAEPVHQRLVAYLTERKQRWPNAINPHLFIHFRNAQHLEPVGYRWLKLTADYPGGVNAIRRDRILHEAHATGGDTRRLCDLFGLSIAAASRFTNSIGHPDLNADVESK